MTPLYFDPAVGFSSKVALSDFVPRAIRLYASRSSSRVASLATGLCVGGSSVWPFTPFLAAQPQEIAASVARTRHVFTRRINQFRPHSHKESNLATTRMPVNQRGSKPGRHSIGPRNVDVKRLNRRPHPADDFAGPERFAQQRHPAVFRLANGAKRVARVDRLVRIQPALRQGARERGIGGLRRRACSNAKCFAFESSKNLPQ